MKTSREGVPLGSFLCVSKFLYRYAKFVCNRQKMVIFSPICALKMHSSYRTHYIIFRAAGRHFMFIGLLRRQIRETTAGRRQKISYTPRSSRGRLGCACIRRRGRADNSGTPCTFCQPKGSP